LVFILKSNGLSEKKKNKQLQRPKMKAVKIGALTDAVAAVSIFFGNCYRRLTCHGPTRTATTIRASPSALRCVSATAEKKKKNGMWQERS
jgi:hypothetical protein